jgi:hypothetical protein
MIPFNKPYLTGKEAHYMYEAKFKIKLSLISYFKEKLSHNFLFILTANIVFFTLFAYLLPIRYEENDDIVMLLFASGKYTGVPEAHLVFINYIYGFFVSFLYTITSKVEWYTLIFTIIHILSLTVIVWSIATKSFKSIFKILFILLFYVTIVR